MVFGLVQAAPQGGGQNFLLDALRGIFGGGGGDSGGSGDIFGGFGGLFGNLFGGGGFNDLSIPSNFAPEEYRYFN